MDERRGASETEDFCGTAKTWRATAEIRVTVSQTNTLYNTKCNITNNDDNLHQCKLRSFMVAFYKFVQAEVSLKI